MDIILFKIYGSKFEPNLDLLNRNLILLHYLIFQKTKYWLYKNFHLQIDTQIGNHIANDTATMWHAEKNLQ